MDYDIEMLKLYFYEHGFTKEEIEKILNQNPFDKYYTRWEAKKQRENKLFADTLKKNKLININTKIQEIAVHENNMVSKFLNNDVEYSSCHFDENINKIIFRNKLLLIKDIFKGEEVFLKKLSLKGIPFIVGVCSDNYQYYNESLNFLKNLRNSINELKFIETKENNSNICIVKKM